MVAKTEEEEEKKKKDQKKDNNNNNNNKNTACELHLCGCVRSSLNFSHI